MLRVACIPGHHPYVAGVLPRTAPADYAALPPLEGPATKDAPRAGRLPDPVPAVADPRPGQWWPPRMLEARWMAAHADQIDVAHLHFGFEGSTPAALEEWLGAVRAAGIPWAMTVHDLANPHLADQSAHEAALDVLVPAADAVLTLTAGAADEIARRWGRRAAVVPHPQVVPDDDLLAADRTPAAGPGSAGEPAVLGVHLGALRANCDPRPWLGELAAAATAQGVRLDVVANDEVNGDPDRMTRIAELDRILAGGGAHTAAPRVRLVPRMPDAALHAWVAGLDAAALPYRHGTHSGWLEMCWDLGTSVLAPPVGHYAEQHGGEPFCAELTATGAADGLRRLLAARDTGCPWGDPAQRLHGRRAVDAETRRIHEDLYLGLARTATAVVA